MGCLCSKPKVAEERPSSSLRDSMIEMRNTFERRSQQHLNQNVVSENFRKDIKEYYEIDRAIVLGTGISGSVRICVHRATKIQYALKTLNKKNLKPDQYDQLKEEITIMQDLDHPNILRLMECFENKDCIYLVLELCKGGELLDRLNEQTGSHYSERTACKYVHTMLSAIRYCHAHNIVHRDLKLENFLFENDDRDSSLKLIDFGLSRHFDLEKPLMHDAVGTPYYVAPDVLAGNYDARCDVWSIGVIAYMLLSGTPPFCGKRDQDTIQAVKAGRWKFHERLFRAVSPAAKQFITSCLSPLAQRPTAEQALQHEWFRFLRNDSPTAAINPDVIARLRGFERRSGLTKVCMEVVAHTLLPEQINELRQEFQKFDVDGSGEITLEDLHRALEHALPREEVERVFKDIDFDSTGRIYYHEFLASTISRKAITEENCRIAFEKISSHNDVITSADLSGLLGVDATWRSVESMLTEVGLPANAELDFNNFKRIMMDTGALSKPPIRRRLTFVSKDEVEVVRRKSVAINALPAGYLFADRPDVNPRDRSSLYYPEATASPLHIASSTPSTSSTATSSKMGSIAEEDE